MKCVVAGMCYTHRGYWIMKDKQGIWIHRCLHIFPTFTDAKEYINKTTDGTNKREPRIIGEWCAENA